MNIEISGRSIAVTRYTLRAAEIGGWFGEVVIGADDIEPGPCSIGGWRGTIRTVHREGRIAHLDVRAGDDSLDNATAARQWAATVPAASVVAQLAGEAGTAGTAPGTLATWRAHGRTLREEIARLARWLAGGAWRVDELTGEVTIGARDGSSADPPGTLTAAGPIWRAYAADPAAPLPVLTGRVVDGSPVGRVIYVWNGSGLPLIELYAREAPAAAPLGAIVGGTVESETNDRATVRLDSGEVLGDVVLYFVPGVRATVPKGTRVLVADLGGDPRAPVAFCSPFDATCERLDLADAHAPVLRVGDIVMLPVGPGDIPTPTPLQLGPGMSAAPGAPGSGHSKVHA